MVLWGGDPAQPRSPATSLPAQRTTCTFTYDILQFDHEFTPLTSLHLSSSISTLLRIQLALGYVGQPSFVGGACGSCVRRGDRGRSAACALAEQRCGSRWWLGGRHTRCRRWKNTWSKFGTRIAVAEPVCTRWREAGVRRETVRDWCGSHSEFHARRISVIYARPRAPPPLRSATLPRFLLRSSTLRSIYPHSLATHTHTHTHTHLHRQFRTRPGSTL